MICFNVFVALAAARDAMGLKARDYHSNVVYAQCNTHFCFENGKKNLCTTFRNADLNDISANSNNVEGFDKH